MEGLKLSADVRDIFQHHYEPVKVTRKEKKCGKKSIPNYLYSKKVFAFNSLVGFSQQDDEKAFHKGKFLKQKYSSFS